VKTAVIKGAGNVFFTVTAAFIAYQGDSGLVIIQHIARPFIPRPPLRSANFDRKNNGVSSPAGAPEPRRFQIASSITRLVAPAVCALRAVVGMT